jgi:hypothetical protein
LEAYLGEWTPRNVYRRAAGAVAAAKESCEEMLKNILMPRLVRVLSPFPEARAAVVQMFVEMHREGMEIPGCGG